MKAIERKYNMSNADLAMLVSNMVVFMNRDSTEFAGRGVDAAAITAFETLGNAFEVLAPDEYYKAAITGEVDLKITERATASVSIQKISGFFEQKWGTDDFRYKQLRIKSFHNMSDNNFLVTCRNVAAVAEEYLLDLTAEGLVQADIDALTATAQSFEDKLNNIAQKKAERDEKTAERTEKGNELYDYVKEYSTVGKLIWENVDEAKYNDYVIYHTPPGTPGKVLDMAYDLPSTTVSWSAASGAEDYQLQRKASGAPDWAVIYEGADTNVLDDPGSGSWLYRCRGQNAEGYGEWSDELTVIIPV